jgi:hypothetical protein
MIRRALYGIGIILARDRTEAEELRDGDSAMRSPDGFTTEIAAVPQLVTPSATYDEQSG